MTCRAPFVLAFAAALAACDASLGPDSTVRDSAVAEDARTQDSGALDAPIDARPCTGGNAAMTAPDGSCFVHVTTPVTYAAAKLACQQMTAHLAYIKTAQLDMFAEQFIGAVDTWIGGSDLVTEGTFLWDDGTAFSYTNWGTNEPNNGNNAYQEDCVIIAGSRATKQWDDRPCDASEVSTSGRFAYLCQY